MYLEGEPCRRVVCSWFMEPDGAGYSESKACIENVRLAQSRFRRET